MEQCRGVSMLHWIAEMIGQPVPVGDYPVDPRQFHQEQMILKDGGITGIVGADQRIVMGGDIAPPLLLLLRIEIVHGPVPSPTRTHRPRYIPWHVVDQNQWPLRPAG